MRSGSARALLLLAFALPATGLTLDPDRSRASGDASLVLAAARAPDARIWWGRVERVWTLDRHGRAAELTVERAWRGSAPEAPVRIAWEELAIGRDPRLEAQERVLVVAQPLAESSLWRARQPGSGTLAIAGEGRAFLREPEAATLDALGAWLASPPESAAAWLELALRAEPRVTQAAIADLAGRPSLASELDAASLMRIRRALAEGDRTEALLGLVGAARLEALRPETEGLAVPGSSHRPAALRALSRLPGGLGDARLTKLLDDPDPTLRSLAAQHAESFVALLRLEALASSDPAAPVRATAATRLVEQRGLAAFDAVKPALLDADGGVRLAAARSLGQLGGIAVPHLETLALQQRGPEALSVIGALVHAGAPARAALARVAHTHPDPAARRFAELVLHRRLADRH